MVASIRYACTNLSECDVRKHLAAVQAEQAAARAAMQPLLEQHQRQLQLRQLAVKAQSSACARDYYQHVRRLLGFAHAGASALSSGAVAASGKPMGGGRQGCWEELNELLLKAVGRAVEHMPLIGAGASALHTILEMVDSRENTLHVRRIATLARTSAELNALVDAVALKLTLLQWRTVSSQAALEQLTSAATFRDAVVQQIGRVRAHAMYLVRGRQQLNNSEKKALADVEALLHALAVGHLHMGCEPEQSADPLSRAECLAARCVKYLLPDLKHHDETAVVIDAELVEQNSIRNDTSADSPSSFTSSSWEIPDVADCGAAAAAGPSVVRTPSRANSAAAAASASFSASSSPVHLSTSQHPPLLFTTSMFLSMRAQIHALEALNAERAAQDALRAEQERRQQSEMRKLKKKQAAHEAHIVKMSAAAATSAHCTAGQLKTSNGGVMLSAQPSTSKRDAGASADAVAVRLLEQRVTELTAAVARMQQQLEEHGLHDGSERPSANVQNQAAARAELAEVKAELMRKSQHM
jgi:hypothetical protein